LAPLAILNENAGNWNPKCDAYADITRKVVTETGATLADLRKAFVAYTKNHGYDVLPDGSMTYSARVLAYDGVHINDRGSAIVAEVFAQAIYDALNK